MARFYITTFDKNVMMVIMQLAGLFTCCSWCSLCWREQNTSVLKITLYVPSGGGKMLLLEGEIGNMGTSRRKGPPVDLRAASVIFFSLLYLL